MHHVPAVIGHVQLHQAMRIRPDPPRDGSLENNFLVRVIRRIAMMREQRNGDEEHGGSYKGNGPDHFHHGTPSDSFTGHDSYLCNRPRVGTIPTRTVFIAQMRTLYTRMRSS